VREERGYSSLTPDIRESATTAGDVLLCLSLAPPPARTVFFFHFVLSIFIPLDSAPRLRAALAGRFPPKPKCNKKRELSGIRRRN